jgi:thiosulfate dehydrogenase
MKIFESSWFPVILGLLIVIFTLRSVFSSAEEKPDDFFLLEPDDRNEWKAPDPSSLPHDEQGILVRYGRDLIVNTALFLGPKGKVASVSNGMDCQNCHIDAGARNFGGSFSAVASTYPRFRERSGRVESIEFRINDCLQRSLNGKTIDSAGREMQAMVAYLKWIGKDVPKKETPVGAGLEALEFLDRAADPEKGKLVYSANCVSCHGDNGQGQFSHDSSFYLYPPLWGENSFNVSAGLYRISRLASFVKNNMPFGQATHKSPRLSNEEAWDVAAYIVSQQRPEKFFGEDWPNVQTKPVDHPYGPFADSFSEKQHKYGPFLPIIKARKKKS